MKKLFFAIAVLAIAILSCKEPKSVRYALFSGIIKNSNDNELTIIDSYDKVVKRIKVSSTGEFSDTIFNPNGYLSFLYETEVSSIYLKNGYNITLNADIKKFNKTIFYTGIGSDVNNYLAQKFLVTEKVGEMKDVYSMNETDFLTAMDFQKKELLNILKTDLDPDFVTSEKIAIKYLYIAEVSN